MSYHIPGERLLTISAKCLGLALGIANTSSFAEAGTIMTVYNSAPTQGLACQSSLSRAIVLCASSGYSKVTKVNCQCAPVTDSGSYECVASVSCQ
jgi:hypothetical protein